MTHPIALGICSVTFRDESPERIIQLASRAKLDAIEWGADIHVRPGEFKEAERIGNLTRENGLEVSSYGSYYKLGSNASNFLTVLETAKALGASAIRVWAGEKGSREADEEYRTKVVEDAKKIAAVANAENISIHLEFHEQTLTDTGESARDLMLAIQHPNVYVYWQPPNHVSVEERIHSIHKVKEWISNIHIFHWYSYENRMTLAEGRDDWLTYLANIQQDNRARYVLMEFIKGDNQEQFLKDAKVLHELKNAITR
ncbi:sugar phosphate isomerase/epimerase [Gracilibacillus halotolerans]|uniref:Sugar phosphate isomerase/epimerase n=1 Tax=Gracilibacillus halotolerans TaxID=74386 RepID=A0A841RL67_9BACI|nr:TIM barrel protein [Gracilibacillus halotolerans]MBB6512206.1 sugar phosphate isomerase/epimerase [Gracilibacillus halotolerans]